MKDTLVIERFFPKEEERSYIKLPFSVPENVESMDITYAYAGDKANSNVTGEKKNVIDFGLLDENGDDAGTRGSSVRRVFISPYGSTSGYKRRSVSAGTWTAVLGAYQVRDEGVTVKITIVFAYKKRQWLKGDTHTHTTNSDGKLSHQALAEKAKKKGLDYIFFTDHNNNMVGIAPPSVDGLTMIKGVELTNYQGHMNMWGVEKPYDGSFAINSKEEFLVYNEQARDRGAVLTLCHPLCSRCPWLMGFDDIHYDVIEIWNGPMRNDNVRCIEWWDSLLKQGKRIPAVGGSDYHQDFVVTDLLAEPTTVVNAFGRSPTDILLAIKEGRCVVTTKTHGTMIDINIDGKGIGDTASFKEGQKAKITVTKMKRGHWLEVVDQDGISFTFKAKRKGDYTFDVPVRGKGYVRADVKFNKRGLSRLIHRIVLFFMMREEAFAVIPPFPFTVANPVYVE